MIEFSLSWCISDECLCMMLFNAFLIQSIKIRLHINARNYMHKHGRHASSTPVGLQQSHSHMHMCRSASEALLCTGLVSHACTHHFLLMQHWAFHALLSVDGEFAIRHTTIRPLPSPPTSPPPPSLSSLTCPPLSSTVVIEDENGDEEAMKNGTVKTSGEA
ncbi:hypothetical protein CHARACLAT_024222 [Characodon lateralis]|uniref:Uncharacterized protein n=1 Tax=Characodon lateralis TaxID=208331 RepID=A0ABU7DJF0_9TELE|nr:hypothetical protein [Characodon lateralis]